MMPFKYLMDVLRGRETRLDKIERRLGRIESTLSRYSPPKQRTQPSRPEQRDQRRTSDIGKVKVRRKSTEDMGSRKEVKRARTVHGPDGWHMTGAEDRGGLHFKEFTRNWLIEFDCPHCGKSSARGVKHLWTEFEDDHTNYQVKLKCRHCGWESDKINIRGYK